MPFGDIVVLMIVAAVVCALGSAVAIVLAWRGKRVDDHPLCANCGQDLTGIGDDRSACPECGSAVSIADKRGIKVGNRQRRHGMLRIGIVVLIVSCSLLATVVAVTVRGVDLYVYMPMALVLSDLESGSPEVSNRAFDELDDRLTNRKLSDAGHDQVIEGLLALQADEDFGWTSRSGYAHDWNEKIGTMIVKLIADGHATDEQRDRYISSVMITTMRARPRVTAGAKFPFGLRQVRRGAEPGPGFRAAPWMYELQIDGLRLVGGPTLDHHHRNGRPAYLKSSFHGNYGSRSFKDVLIPEDTLPGDYEVEVVYSEKVFDGEGRDAAVIYERAGQIQLLPLEVLPADERSAKASESDEDVDQKMRDSFHWGISPREPDFSTSAQLITRAGEHHIRIRFYWVNPPKSAVFDRYLVYEGIEPRRSGRMRVTADEDASHWHTHVVRTDAPPETITVILRSSVDIAEDTYDVFETWEGEIVFEDIPVKAEP